MAEKDSGASCLVLAVALVLGVAPCLYIADFLVQHYGVTDDLTIGIIYAATIAVLVRPFGSLILILLGGFLVYFVAPMLWVVEWWHRPNWKNFDAGEK